METPKDSKQIHQTDIKQTARRRQQQPISTNSCDQFIMYQASKLFTSRIMIFSLVAILSIYGIEANDEADGQRILISSIRELGYKMQEVPFRPEEPNPIGRIFQFHQLEPKGKPIGRNTRAAGSDRFSSTLLMAPLSGSKSEPPSRPPVDWSKQRPYFGNDMLRNVSVELGRKATLVCKVYELGDKTVSWLRPLEKEILTVGSFTYAGDPRFSSTNDGKSAEWILEIRDVGLNDSTSYECQVNTDPKMSFIINLNVRAAKARIRQGESYFASSGSSIEFTCDLGTSKGSPSRLQTPSMSGSKQTYWYYNGNLLNYAQTQPQMEKNFTIERDPISQTSRFKLFGVQMSDSGNYTCKPSSAEPATIQLSVKKPSRNGNRTGHNSNNNNNGHSKDSQRTLRRYNELSSSGVEFVSHNAATSILLARPLHSILSFLVLYWIIIHINICR